MNFPFGLGNLVSGVLETNAPGILKGIFTELLDDISTTEAIDWINTDHRMWDDIDQEQREQIKTYAPKIKDWSWLTSDWLIANLAQDLPALCSLFLGWKKGRNWLDRQIVDLKKEAGV